MHHQPRPCSAGIGLGSHDLGVAAFAADLYHVGLFPVLVFTGANSPTTAARFPRGEAVHYAEHVIALGVPADAIIIEPACLISPMQDRRRSQRSSPRTPSHGEKQESAAPPLDDDNPTGEGAVLDSGTPLASPGLNSRYLNSRCRK